MKLSVLTIVRGRREHLQNQLQGLYQSLRTPDEWIVVGMGEQPQISPTSAFPCRFGQVSHDGGNLPLAAARNMAAELASGELLVFLDVDCIPSATLLGEFERAIKQIPQLWMGSVQYLPPNATEGLWSLQKLDALAEQHRLLPKLHPTELMPERRHEMFWSLCFGLTRETFQTIGGFDETFHGYGAEDTDFAFAARDRAVGFGVVGAKAYHQHHAVCQPPLNHFTQIIQNAIHFRQKWQVWPMQSWLQAFAERGLVDFNEEQDVLQVLRSPSPEEVRRATVMDAATL
ncbi:glycosyltransferase [bacterium]|nr:glycosyltransferase [bacterium]